MRHAVLDCEDVAGGEVVGDAAVQAACPDLARRDRARLDHLTSGHDLRGSLEHVHHVDDVLVVLDLAGRLAATGIDLVTLRVEQQSAGLELRLDDVAGEEGGPVRATVPSLDERL